MKKIVIILIILIALLCGPVIADRGIDPVPETQGITTATTIDLVGNMASDTDIQWRISDDPDGLDGIPPLEILATVYSSSYTEETYSNGLGLIAYDKNMDVETSEQLSGQWNIEAEKQIEFVGVDGARVYSDENIMVDGIGEFSEIDEEDMLCIFAYDFPYDWVFPAFCNYAEAGSTVDMTVANVRTNSMDRFINPTSDTSVELEHDILVTELIDGLPSSGTASAHMDVLIMEASVLTGELISPLAEQIEFSEVSTITGDISVFDKQMNYDSKLTSPGRYIPITEHHITLFS